MNNQQFKEEHPDLSESAWQSRAGKLKRMVEFYQNKAFMLKHENKILKNRLYARNKAEQSVYVRQDHGQDTTSVEMKKVCM